MTSSNLIRKDTLVLVDCSEKLKRHLISRWSVGSTQSLSEPIRIRETKLVVSVAEAIPMLAINDAVFTDFENVLTFLSATRFAEKVNVKFVHAFESPVGADWVKFNDLFSDRGFSSSLGDSHKLFYKMLTDANERTAAA